MPGYPFTKRKWNRSLSRVIRNRIEERKAARRKINRFAAAAMARTNAAAYSYRPSANIAAGRPNSMFVQPRPQKQRGLNPFPREFLVKMHYGHWTGLTVPGGGVAGGINFRLNSLFDPDLSGVGHQVYQYDQLTALYNKSIVLACKVELRWSNPSADGLYVGYSVVGPVSAPAAGKGIDYIKELPTAQVIPMNNSGSQVRTQTVYVKLHQLFGVDKKAFIANTTYHETMGAATTVPNALIQPFVIDPSGGSSMNVALEIKLTYYAKLWEFKDPGQS